MSQSTLPPSVAPANMPAASVPESGGAATANPTDQIVAVRLDELRDAPWQPRGTDHPSELEALADSISDSGVLEPAVVRPHPDGRGYELLAGHRRRDAIRLLAERTDPLTPSLPDALRDPADGAPALPARVLHVDELAARRITFAENAHRADLCAWDRAQAVAAYRDALAESASAAAPEQKLVAEKLRLAEATVSECLKIAATLTVDVQDAASAAWNLSHAHPDMHHALRRLSHLALCRAARQRDPAARAGVLRTALDRVRRKGDQAAVGPATPQGRQREAGGAAAPTPGSRDAAQTRRERYRRLQTGEAFDYRRNNGLVAYDPPAARSQLDELAPAVGVLAERAAGGAPVVLETGDGGTVVVLPGDPTTMPAEALGAALATLIELRQHLEAVRAERADAASPSPRAAAGTSTGAIASRPARGSAPAASERTTAAPSGERSETPPPGAALPSDTDHESRPAKLVQLGFMI